MGFANPSEAMGSPVTLATLERRLGLAKSTISRALRNDPRVAEATRQRVLEVAKEEGYRPNPLLSELAGRRWRADAGQARIPVAFIDHSPLTDRTAFYRHYFLGAAAQARERGFLLERFYLTDYPENMRLSQVLETRGVQGVIVGPLRYREPALRLAWDRFSLVSCGGDFYPPPTHKVQVNQLQTVTLAFRTAIQHGYRRIGAALFLHEEETPDDGERLGAFAYQQFLYRDRLPSLRALTSRDPDEFRRWVEAERPDVVIGFTDMVLGWLREMGKRVPEDMGFISLHKSDAAECACIDNVEMEVGRAAMEFLEQQIRSNQKGLPEHRRFIYTESVLRMGPSLRQVGELPQELARRLEKRSTTGVVPS